MPEASGEDNGLAVLSPKSFGRLDYQVAPREASSRTPATGAVRVAYSSMDQRRTTARTKSSNQTAPRRHIQKAMTSNKLSPSS